MSVPGKILKVGRGKGAASSPSVLSGAGVVIIAVVTIIPASIVVFPIFSPSCSSRPGAPHRRWRRTKMTMVGKMLMKIVVWGTHGLNL